MAVMEKDNFDRFVDWATTWKGLKWFYKPYYKYRQLWLYALFGLGTVLFSINTYALFTENWNWPILVANAISWIFATMFAFLTNRQWVFTSRKHGRAAFFQQLGSFFAGRFATLLLEEWMLYFFVEKLGLPNMFIKYVAQVAVIVTNYFISKLLVFRKRAQMKEAALSDMDDDFT